MTYPKSIIIVGGGVAGLSALNRLIDLGVSATLIEGGTYPSHKLCGEFFSHECLSILNEWNCLPVAEINHISLISPNSKLFLDLPFPCRSHSRYTFDLQLLKRAQEKGATVLTGTKVVKIEPQCVILDNGLELPYTDLIISAGKFFKSGSPQYIGIKTHLKGIQLDNHLQMYLFKGGYAGLSPIGEDQVNFACLMKNNISLKDPLSYIFQQAPRLKERLEKASLVLDKAMVCSISSFGIKKNRDKPNTFYIGDAAGTIPPASGLGLTIALTSGYKVADYVLKGNFVEFRRDWKKTYSPLFSYGHFLHHLFMRPFIYELSAKLAHFFPSLPLKIFQMRGQ